MTLTPKGQIEREGRVSFGDASLSVWEDGISAARAAGDYDGEKRWELQFKRDVFKRIIQTLNRLGWTVGPQHYIFTGDNSRFCTKSDLKADLRISGRHIEFNMFQSVNCPTRSDYEGRYESNKEACMPYLLRLEMLRTRQRICDYLCAVFTGYTVKPEGVSSPNPDPLAYFNDSWGSSRFKRGADGWPSDNELSSWARDDKDGNQLNHGDVRWIRDCKGRLLRGHVYGGINGMWMLVYGPGSKDHTHANATQFFTYRHGEAPRKVINERQRRKRLEGLLADAVKAMDFKRAEVLKMILWPTPEPLFHIVKEGAYFRSDYCGYTTNVVDAGKYTKTELKPYASDIANGSLKAIPIAA